MQHDDPSSTHSQDQIPASVPDGWEEGGELLEAGRKEMLRLAARWPAQEQKRAQSAIPDSLTDFDLSFQEVAGPKLLRLVVATAPLVALEVYEFRAACDLVWRAAATYGAGHLSDAARYEWIDWIAREILTRLNDPLPEGLVTPARLAEITGEPR